MKNKFKYETLILIRKTIRKTVLYPKVFSFLYAKAKTMSSKIFLFVFLSVVTVGLYFLLTGVNSLAATVYYKIDAETGNLNQWFPDAGPSGGGVTVYGDGCGGYCMPAYSSSAQPWVYAQSDIVHLGNYAYMCRLTDTSYQNHSKLETWQDARDGITEAYWSEWVYISSDFKSTQGINITQWKTAYGDCGSSEPLIVLEAYKNTSNNQVYFRLVDWPAISCTGKPADRPYSGAPNPNNAVPLNTWIHLEFQMKFADNNQGFFRVWRDGANIFSKENITTTRTCHQGQAFGSINCSSTAFGVGMYSSPADYDNQTAYFDDIIMTDYLVSAPLTQFLLFVPADYPQVCLQAEQRKPIFLLLPTKTLSVNTRQQPIPFMSQCRTLFPIPELLPTKH